MPANKGAATGYEGVVHAGLLRGFKMVLPFGAMLYLAFSLLDYYAYPELMDVFLKLRIGISVFIFTSFMMGVYVHDKRLLVWLSDLLIIVACCGIIAMIAMADNSLSYYYEGINLVFLVMFTINSYKTLHNLITGLIVLVIYSTVLFINPQGVDIPHFVAALFFMGSTLAFVVMMTKLYGSQRQIEHTQTMALAESAKKLSDANEQLIATENLKNDFFANASHELRTPLTLILGATHNLRRKHEFMQDAERDLNLVVRNAELLLKHVNELLDIAKIDANKMSILYGNVDVAKLVRLICSHFMGLAEQRHIRFEINGPQELPAQIDANKIEHVLLNLLSNAFKFTPDHGEVRVDLESMQEEIKVRISDTGIGTTSEQKERIFERFRQVESQETNRLVGSGLGLAIANEFVTLHGGNLEVLDALPQGSIFKVSLPRFAPRATHVADQPVSFLDTIAPLTLADHRIESTIHSRLLKNQRNLPRILIVEDNIDMRHYLRSLLENEYQIMEACDGDEALRIIALSLPDLVISDVMMPKLDGKRLVKKIRDDARCIGIPILLLSARADSESREECLRNGAHDYVVKPFSESELKARVSNLVSNKLARDVLSKELSTSQGDLVTLTKELVNANHSVERSLQAARVSARAKEDFLSLLSHELRTPLTSIMGWADLLRDFDTNPEMLKEGLESIERNGQSLLELIDGLLDSTLMGRGRMRLSIERVSLEVPLEAALSAVVFPARAKNITIETSLPQADVFVECDCDRLQQVVVNLLSNAIKYSHKGGHIHIALYSEGDTASLSITDKGEGISTDVMPYIFERFRLGDQSNRRTHGGLGMGLAIARDIVELHGGKLTAKSAGPGKGACFTIELAHAPQKESSWNHAARPTTSSIDTK